MSHYLQTFTKTSHLDFPYKGLLVLILPQRLCWSQAGHPFLWHNLSSPLNLSPGLLSPSGLDGIRPDTLDGALCGDDGHLCDHEGRRVGFLVSLGTLVLPPSWMGPACQDLPGLVCCPTSCHVGA